MGIKDFQIVLMEPGVISEFPVDFFAKEPPKAFVLNQSFEAEPASITLLCGAVYVPMFEVGATGATEKEALQNLKKKVREIQKKFLKEVRQLSKGFTISKTEKVPTDALVMPVDTGKAEVFKDFDNSYYTFFRMGLAVLDNRAVAKRRI
jgi:hypothetical protein